MQMTLIQQYASSLIRSAADQAKVLDKMDHDTTKGRYREIFVKDVLARFLTAQFGIGSGVIVNQRGDQSRQQDVIVYDRRVLPPFLDAEGLGVFPIESVLATIEVKSTLRNEHIHQTETSAKQLEAMASGSIYPERLCPSTSIVGFWPDENLTCRNATPNAADWLSSNASMLFAVNVIGCISWVRLADWRCQVADTYFEETKGYLAVLGDNLRTAAERRLTLLSNVHRDWLSVYTRFDCSGARLLRGEMGSTFASTTSSSTTTSAGSTVPSSLAPNSTANWCPKTPEPEEQPSGDLWCDPACIDPCKNWHER